MSNRNQQTTAKGSQPAPSGGQRFQRKRQETVKTPSVPDLPVRPLAFNRRRDDELSARLRAERESAVRTLREQDPLRIASRLLQELDMVERALIEGKDVGAAAAATAAAPARPSISSLPASFTGSIATQTGALPPPPQPDDEEFGLPSGGSAAVAAGGLLRPSESHLGRLPGPSPREVMLRTWGVDQGVTPGPHNAPVPGASGSGLGTVASGALLAAPLAPSLAAAGAAPFDPFSICPLTGRPLGLPRAPAAPEAPIAPFSTRGLGTGGMGGRQPLLPVMRSRAALLHPSQSRSVLLDKSTTALATLGYLAEEAAAAQQLQLQQQQQQQQQGGEETAAATAAATARADSAVALRLAGALPGSQPVGQQGPMALQFVPLTAWPLFPAAHSAVLEPVDIAKVRAIADGVIASSTAPLPPTPAPESTDVGVTTAVPSSGSSNSAALAAQDTTRKAGMGRPPLPGSARAGPTRLSHSSSSSSSFSSSAAAGHVAAAAGAGGTGGTAASSLLSTLSMRSQVPLHALEAAAASAAVGPSADAHPQSARGSSVLVASGSASLLPAAASVRGRSSVALLNGSPAKSLPYTAGDVLRGALVPRPPPVGVIPEASYLTADPLMQSHKRIVERVAGGDLDAPVDADLLSPYRNLRTTYRLPHILGDLHSPPSHYYGGVSAGGAGVRGSSGGGARSAGDAPTSRPSSSSSPSPSGHSGSRPSSSADPAREHASTPSGSGARGGSAGQRARTPAMGTIPFPLGPAAGAAVEGGATPSSSSSSSSSGTGAAGVLSRAFRDTVLRVEGPLEADDLEAVLASTLKALRRGDDDLLREASEPIVPSDAGADLFLRGGEASAPPAAWARAAQRARADEHRRQRRERVEGLAREAREAEAAVLAARPRAEEQQQQQAEERSQSMRGHRRGLSRMQLNLAASGPAESASLSTPSAASAASIFSPPTPAGSTTSATSGGTGFGSSSSSSSSSTSASAVGSAATGAGAGAGAGPAETGSLRQHNRGASMPLAPQPAGLGPSLSGSGATASQGGSGPRHTRNPSAV